MRSIASNYGHELRDLPEIQGNATAFNSYPTGPWQLMGTNLAIVGFWPNPAFLHVSFGAPGFLGILKSHEDQKLNLSELGSPMLTSTLPPIPCPSLSPSDGAKAG